MNIQTLVKIYVKLIKANTIVFTPLTRKWCKLPYKNYKQCPNYNKNPLCPPKAPYLDNLPNLYNYFYLIYAKFNFEKYKIEMKKLHPDWTDLQIANLLYWQNQIKKLLKEKILTISNPEKFILGCGGGLLNSSAMEAVGIWVFSTLVKNNIDFEIKPKSKIILVCLVCLNNPIKFNIQKEIFG